MKLTDIPQYTKAATYQVDVGWSYLEEHIKIQEESGLDLEPDFQRAHVWNQDQQAKYVEFVLRGGRSGRDLYFNCKNWNRYSIMSDYVIVDGKQRLNAVRKFLRNELPIFSDGSILNNDKPIYLKEFTEPMRMRIHLGFKWHVNDLATRAEVLQWYLDFNAGGVVHTEEELNKVRKMLKKKTK
jgi:hypothetical protein